MYAIDEYVAGLERRLVGPRRTKAELLAEARDSLADAAEAHTARGLDADAAERRAVAEFGRYHEVAPAYQVELAVAQGRRTALLIALALPLLHLLAPLMWLDSPWSGLPRDPHYFDLTAAFDYLTLLGGAIAALVLLGYGRGSRFIRDSRLLTQRLGQWGLVYLAVHGLAGTAVWVWSVVMWPPVLTWPPLLIGGVLMSVSFGYATLCAWRCLRTTDRGYLAAG